jgi:hypothetical protein
MWELMDSIFHLRRCADLVTTPAYNDVFSRESGPFGFDVSG